MRRKSLFIILMIYVVLNSLIPGSLSSAGEEQDCIRITWSLSRATLTLGQELRAYVLLKSPPPHVRVKDVTLISEDVSMQKCTTEVLNDGSYLMTMTVVPKKTGDYRIKALIEVEHNLQEESFVVDVPTFRVDAKPDRLSIILSVLSPLISLVAGASIAWWGMALQKRQTFRAAVVQVKASIITEIEQHIKVLEQTTDVLKMDKWELVRTAGVLFMIQSGKKKEYQQIINYYTTVEQYNNRSSKERLSSRAALLSHAQRLRDIMEQL